MEGGAVADSIELAIYEGGAIADRIGLANNGGEPYMTA